MIMILLVSTKFSIVIGCLRAYLSRNRRVITWVSITGVRFELFGHLKLDTHVIRTSITRAIMASLAMFRSVFKTYKKRYRRFSLTEKFS